MADPKKPRESKTLWVSGLTIAIGVAGLLLGEQVIAQHPQAVAILTAIIGAANFALRLITKDEIAI